MNHLTQLTTLFRPVQPRFKEGGKAIMYRELAPDTLLSGYIGCYWQLKSATPLAAPFNYTAVADGCIDFFFDLNNPDENYVMGFSSGFTTFPLANNFNYAGVRFFPGAFPGLYTMEASALTNQCQYIRDVIPRAYESLKDVLRGQSDLAVIKPLFDRYFKKIVFSNHYSIDARFVESLSMMLTVENPFRVEKDISASISPRHLRRLFDYYIGTAPKEFNRVVRFQKLLGKKLTRENIRKERAYYDAGYYDQSHFIKDFKALYGMAPLKALED